MIDEEIGKYKKKTKSNTSKSKAKSKHKHEYKEVLLICNDKPHWATVCKICGKIGDLRFITLDADEVFEKYKGLEQIQIEDIWQKFVPISGE